MMRMVTMLGSLLSLTLALSAGGEPNLLFCAPWDGATTPAFARGLTAAGTAGGADVLFQLHGPKYEAGQVGQALSLRFGGVHFAAPGNFAESAGTLSLWVRPRWSGSDLSKYATLFGVSGWGLFYKYTDQSYLTFATTKSDGLYDYGCTASIQKWQPGEWHQVAITWDRAAGERRIFLDGQLAGQGQIPGPHPGEKSFWIGATPGGTNPVDGLIDEVYVFDEPLSAGEIEAAYQRARAGQPGWPVPAQPAAPRAAGPQPPRPEQVDWWLEDAPRQKTATREKVSLNGFWRFQPVGGIEAEPPRSGWGYLRVPGSWAQDLGPVYDGAFRPVSGRWGKAALRDYAAA